jgi:phosphonate transport system substrate-binding protein
MQARRAYGFINVSLIASSLRFAIGHFNALAALIFLSSLIQPMEAGATSQESNDGPFRVAFSARMFVGVNENDARASVKVWALALGKEQNIPVDPAIQILSGIDAIASALLRNEIDCITLTTDEYWVLRNRVQMGPFFFGIKNGQITEEYLVLVHERSGINKLEDLHGRSLSIFESPRASLSPIWLNTLLIKSGLPQAEKHFGKIARGSKMNVVILPVFFRQIDACLISRDGFLTMTELNPQVGKQLKVLAQSSPMVPVLFCFRGSYVSKDREKLRASIGNVHKTIAGRQTVTLFQTEKLAEYPIKEIDGAIELLDEYQRLCEQKKVPMEKPAPEMSNIQIETRN